MQTLAGYGAQEGNRTPDLRITSALLYRLSYLGRNRHDTDSGAVPQWPVDPATAR